MTPKLVPFPCYSKDSSNNHGCTCVSMVGYKILCDMLKGGEKWNFEETVEYCIIWEETVSEKDVVHSGWYVDPNFLCWYAYK